MRSSLFRVDNPKEKRLKGGGEPLFWTLHILCRCEHFCSCIQILYIHHEQNWLWITTKLIWGMPENHEQITLNKDDDIAASQIPVMWQCISITIHNNKCPESCKCQIIFQETLISYWKSNNNERAGNSPVKLTMGIIDIDSKHLFYCFNKTAYPCIRILNSMVSLT